jgi:hypothetical protein
MVLRLLVHMFPSYHVKRGTIRVRNSKFQTQTKPRMSESIYSLEKTKLILADSPAAYTL